MVRKGCIVDLWSPDFSRSAIIKAGLLLSNTLVYDQIPAELLSYPTTPAVTLHVSMQTQLFAAAFRVHNGSICSTCGSPCDYGNHRNYWFYWFKLHTSYPAENREIVRYNLLNSVMRLYWWIAAACNLHSLSDGTSLAIVINLQQFLRKKNPLAPFLPSRQHYPPLDVQFHSGSVQSVS